MTTSSNPYRPPQAEVADVISAHEGGFQEMTIWGWRGRVGRLRFLGYGAVAYLVYALLAAAIGVVVGMAGVSDAGAVMAVGVIVWVLAIPYLVFWILIAIRRSHDMGWSGWTSLLMIIPFVALIWVFKAGTPGANAYGAPPPPNTTGVKVAAFGVLGVTLVAVIVTVAVAIPAYMNTPSAGWLLQQAPAK